MPVAAVVLELNSLKKLAVRVDKVCDAVVAMNLVLLRSKISLCQPLYTKV